MFYNNIIDMYNINFSDIFSKKELKEYLTSNEKSVVNEFDIDNENNFCIKKNVKLKDSLGFDFEKQMLFYFNGSNIKLLHFNIVSKNPDYAPFLIYKIEAFENVTKFLRFFILDDDIFTFFKKDYKEFRRIKPVNLECMQDEIKKLFQNGSLHYSFKDIIKKGFFSVNKSSFDFNFNFKNLLDEKIINQIIITNTDKEIKYKDCVVKSISIKNRECENYLEVKSANIKRKDGHSMTVDFAFGKVLFDFKNQYFYFNYAKGIQLFDTKSLRFNFKFKDVMLCEYVGLDLPEIFKSFDYANEIVLENNFFILNKNNFKKINKARSDILKKVKINCENEIYYKIIHYAFYNSKSKLGKKIIDFLKNNLSDWGSINEETITLMLLLNKDIDALYDFCCIVDKKIKMLYDYLEENKISFFKANLKVINQVKMILEK